LGIGAFILSELRQPLTTSDLWCIISNKDENKYLTYDKYILTLDFLFILGLIQLKDDDYLEVKK